MEKKSTDTKTKIKKAATKTAKTVTKEATKKVVAAKKDTAKKVAAVKKETAKKVKDTAKTIEKVAAEKKQEIKEKADEIIAKELNKVECVHCHKYFDKGLTICPYCRKSQKDKTGPIVILVLAIVLLLCIIGSYFVDKYREPSVDKTTYMQTCNLVAYEELVRNPKDYKDKNISVKGTVVSVDGTDMKYGNVMTLTINSNLFDELTRQIIEIQFTDKDYSQGFIAGDLVTVYGEFTEINGNTPRIEAKYIELGQ